MGPGWGTLSTAGVLLQVFLLPVESRRHVVHIQTSYHVPSFYIPHIPNT